MSEAEHAQAHLASFRKLVYAGVKKALAQDGHCKSYEGRVTLTIEAPSYFDQHQRPMLTLELACYVLGPTRHYAWTSFDADDLFRTASADVTRWIAELDD